MSTSTPITAEQLEQISNDGRRYELVRGELRMMSPGNWRHGAIIGRLHLWIAQHVENHGLGRVFGAETGFLIARNPDTVRAPDIAVVLNASLPERDPEESYWPGAPDLVVEVLSPGDADNDVNAKIDDWLSAGSRAVWVVDGDRHTVTIHRSADAPQTFCRDDFLLAAGELPGFEILVTTIFHDRR